MLRPCSLWALALCSLLLSPGDLRAGDSNSLLDISQDGKRLAVSNRDSGTVTILEAPGLKVLREIPVGLHPEGVSFIGSSYQIAVAVYGDDQIQFLDAESGQLSGKIDVFDEPYGVVSTSDGSRLYVTLDYPGQVLEIDPAEKRILRTLPAGSFVRGIALLPDESALMVCEYYSTLVKRIDIASGEVDKQWEGVSTDNLARQLVVHPDGERIYVPHIRSKITAARGSGSIFPYLTVVDDSPVAKRNRRRFPMDSFISVRVTANPWEVAVSPDGKQLVIVFAGTDDAFATRILDDHYRDVEPISHFRLGHNPRAVKYSPDGTRVYIVNALDFNVVAFDSRTFQELDNVQVTENPLSEEILRGKRLFYTALPPMTSRLWISCSSCHPDGDTDGRTWQNPEGLRDTPPLYGLAFTHPLHWSADRDEVQDFEHTIRGQLMQGRGLIRGPVQPQLGPPNSGLSADLDALAAYTNSHHVPLSPHAKQGLSPAAKRGRELFFSKQTRCASCHTGPFFTDSSPSHPGRRHNVGTGLDDPSELMGPEYDTPMLLGVYRTAPYLHHGKAKTLRDVLTKWNREDQHGVTSQLSEQELDDLVEFLRALPYTDPIDAAQQAGLPQVQR